MREIEKDRKDKEILDYDKAERDKKILEVLRLIDEITEVIKADEKCQDEEAQRRIAVGSNDAENQKSDSTNRSLKVKQGSFTQPYVTRPLYLTPNRTIDNIGQPSYVEELTKRYFKDVIAKPINIEAKKIEYAIVRRDSDLAIQLIEGTDKNKWQKYYNFTYQFSLLHTAITNDLNEVAKKLLEKGADVNVKDATGRTPLFYAQNAEIAELLIKNGADVNAKSKNGETPIFDAIGSRRFEVVKLLIDYGADLKVEEKATNKTPLKVSILMRGENHEITKLIREALEEREKATVKTASPQEPQEPQEAEALANEEQETQAVQKNEALKPNGFWANRISKERLEAKEKKEEAVKGEKSFKGFLLI
jgi:hypothetical protein